MKGSGTLVASVLAASTVALGSSSGDRDVSFYSSSNEGVSSSSGSKKVPNTTTSDKEKFAPRFDGLRFIETLVTAHR
ncbi:hypothetical protein PanWU01x14_056810 [Parasponia andersonii]|uniref:CASP-like protein n=1 Tax=Parasponia andersonii TaxID=3476 RepID=A0A2P5DJM4_PARAD|nr:hypothetical protein PanWU01x14_056810 [Parasponia andersonii]